jgi:soluble lytic murein transglycosylase-like protein
MNRIACLCFLSFCLFPAFCLGAENEDFERNFAEAGELWKVPPKLALAIAKQESGLNPWAVNVTGQSYMFKTQEDALRLIDLAWSRGESIDIGLMQINSYWLRRFALEPRLVLKPRNNIILGVWILSKEIERYGLTWEAVASYHTPLDRNPERGRNYAAAVIRQMTSIHKER